MTRILRQMFDANVFSKLMYTDELIWIYKNIYYK